MHGCRQKNGHGRHGSQAGEYPDQTDDENPQPTGGAGGDEAATPQAAGTPPPVTGEPTVTDSGLQYIDIEVGSGATPQTGQTLQVHYTGWLEDGTKFDSSVDRGEPITFTLGTAWPLTGKKVHFTYKKSASDATAILAAECTVTDAVNGIATYTPATTAFPTAGKYVYDVCVTETDGTLPQTAFIGTLKIQQDVKA